MGTRRQVVIQSGAAEPSPTPLSGAEPSKGVPQPTQRPAPKPKISSRRYQKAAALVDPHQKYPIKEAVELVKRSASEGFDASVELHLTFKKQPPLLPPDLALPHGSGKKLKVLVFAGGATAKKALAAGAATVISTEKELKDLQKGSLNYDLAIATPDLMPKVLPLGKTLGPVGLMPNPKTGTVSEHPEDVIKEFGAGKIQLKTEKGQPLVHLVVGRVSFTNDQLAENTLAVLASLGSQEIKKITLCSTMGPGIKLSF